MFRKKESRSSPCRNLNCRLYEGKAIAAPSFLKLHLQVLCVVKSGWSTEESLGCVGGM